MVSDRLRAAIGVWVDEGAPSFPVDRSDIRRWAIATYWPHEPPRQYWDEEYAQTTRWGGIIAPNDFNPGAWPVQRLADVPRPYLPEKGELGQRMLYGGIELHFGQPIRPGDIIRTRSRVASADEREGKFGQMLYIRVEWEMRNQSDDVVRTRFDTLIRY